MFSVGEGNRFFDREEKAAFGPEAEVLVLDLDEPSWWDFSPFGSVDADSDLAAAGKASLFFPVALTCGSLVILRHNRVAAIGRSQAIDDQAIIEITLELITVIERDEILIFCAIETQSGGKLVLP